MPERIIIARNSSKDIQMRDLYLVLDDGDEINLEFGDVVEIQADKGDHKIRVTNRVYSQRLDFNLGEGGSAKFEVVNVSARGLFSFLMMLVGTVPYKPSIRQIE